jgi:hypothetical protein
MAYPLEKLTRWLPLFAVMACQRLDVDSGEESSPSLETGTGTTSDDDDDDDDDDDSSEDSEDPDTGGPTEFDCDPVAQTGCNGSEKCTVVLQAGVPAYVCVDDDQTIDPFDGCEEALGSGADGCPGGYACLADETDVGLCVPLCLDSSDCSDAVCLPELEDDIPYCASECSPFEGGCAAPLQCRRSEDRFACRFARPDDTGGQGDACTQLQDAGCAEGLVCLAGALVPGCASDNCCTVVCDTGVDTCDSPSTCVPLFDAPAPGNESIGACLVPA